MDTIYTDQRLREALYSIYVAQFRAMKRYPKVFTNADATRMLTGLMASRPWSWRVIGITPAALEVFKENDFKRPAGEIQRGHKEDRASTARAVYQDRDKPMLLPEFFEFFLERDQTVLMTKAENRHRPGGKFPRYIRVPQKLELFPCGTLVGWQHRKAETEFLRELYAKQNR